MIKKRCKFCCPVILPITTDVNQLAFKNKKTWFTVKVVTVSSFYVFFALFFDAFVETVFKMISIIP